MTTRTGRDDLLADELGAAISGTLRIDPRLATAQAAATVRTAQAFYGS